jgi:hypothetical protein
VATTHLAPITGAPCAKVPVEKNNTHKWLTMNGVSKYYLKKVTETVLLQFNRSKIWSCEETILYFNTVCTVHYVKFNLTNYSCIRN